MNNTWSDVLTRAFIDNVDAASRIIKPDNGRDTAPAPRSKRVMRVRVDSERSVR